MSYYFIFELTVKGSRSLTILPFICRLTSMKLIIRLLVTAAVSFILAQILPGVHTDSYVTTLWFAIVLALLNVFLKPFLIIFTLPLTVFTFGLFLFVINTITVLLASNWVENFRIDSFGHGLLFSLLLTLITSALFREEDRQRRQEKSPEEN